MPADGRRRRKWFLKFFCYPLFLKKFLIYTEHTIFISFFSIRYSFSLITFKLLRPKLITSPPLHRTSPLQTRKNIDRRKEAIFSAAAERRRSVLVYYVCAVRKWGGKKDMSARRRKNEFPFFLSEENEAIYCNKRLLVFSAFILLATSLQFFCSAQKISQTRKNNFHDAYLQTDILTYFFQTPARKFHLHRQSSS